MTETHNRSAALVLAVAGAAGLVCLFIYLPALSFGFMNLDDRSYVTGNALIKSLDRVAFLRIFTESHLAAWIPFTYLSFALDYHFWGDNPFGYHLTNILLHALNVSMVVLLVDRFSLKLSAATDLQTGGRWSYAGVLLLAGLLFGLHPLRVESVAWVAERKDVLNGLFSLAAVLAYCGYTSLDGKNRVGHRRFYYLLSLSLFACSLLAKQVSVTLPLMLLVVDWYPLNRLRPGRIWRVILEKAPFLLLSLLVTLLTLKLASRGVLVTAENFPFYARLFVSGNALFEYCRLILWPVGILPLYVTGETLETAFIVKTLLVGIFTGYCCWCFRRAPFLTAVWFLFLLPLLPVLAFTQAADDTALASRYTYLPSVAITAAAGVLLACRYQAGGKRGRTLLPGLMLVIVAGYGAITWRILPAWRDDGTLWTRQLELQPLGRAYNYRGIHYYSVGNFPAAINDFTSAMQIGQNSGREDIFNLYAYRGEAWRALGQHHEAIRDFTTAIDMSPYPVYFYFRGSSLQALGRTAEAAADFRRAGSARGPISWHPARAE